MDNTEHKFSDSIEKLTKANEFSRTEEINDIIDRMPTKFGYYVGSILVGLFGLLLLFGFLIKYPDIQKGQITLTARQAPVKLIASGAGKIDLLIRESGKEVKADEYIAIIKNAAITNDVKLVDSFLKAIDIHSVNYESHRSFFPENVSLGEISNKYFSFLNSLYQYLDYYKEKPFDKQRDILEKLSFTQQKNLQQAIDEYKRLKNKYQLAFSFYKRQEKLFTEDVIAPAELEKAKISLITSEQEFKGIDKEITSSNYQIQDVGNKLQQLVFQRLDKDRQLEVELLNSFYEILESIKQWEHKYAFVAPLSGKVEFLTFLKQDDYIQTGQELFSVIPENNEIYGQLVLPEMGAGKVAPGQTVIIKLDDFPYTQFGSIKGQVKSISAMTNQQIMSNAQTKIPAYLVTVTLPNGLKTNFDNSLSFRFDSKGTGEIVTNSRRLIDRLFDNIRHSVKK